MLEYLKVKNFQVFEDLYIEFHPGLNAIVAPSDYGKSSIIRLLDWMFTNHQLRYNYQNDKSKTVRGAKVSVEIGIDSHVVQRVKGKTENYYQLDDNKPLEAIYNDVPDPIKQLFNMDSINIHRQHSKHFLLGETSGDVGKFINNVVNLDVLSKAPKYAEAKVRSSKKEADDKQKEIKLIEQQLKGYTWIDDFEIKLDRLAKKEQILNIKQQEVNELDSLLQQYDKLVYELESYQGFDELKKRTDKLIVFKSDIERLGNEYTELCDLIEQYDELEQELAQSENLQGLYDKTCLLLDRVKDINQEIRQYNELDELIDNYDQLQTKHKSLSATVDRLNKEFKELMPEVCPLCGK